jgi:hypothetical protein
LHSYLSTKGSTFTTDVALAKFRPIATSLNRKNYDHRPIS